MEERLQSEYDQILKIKQGEDGDKPLDLTLLQQIQDCMLPTQITS